MECDTSQGKAKYHTRCAPYHDPPSADFIDPFQSDESKNKICSRDDETNRGRLVKTDRFEKCCRVIHEGIKSAQLLKRLESTCDD